MNNKIAYWIFAGAIFCMIPNASAGFVTEHTPCPTPNGSQPGILVAGSICVASPGQQVEGSAWLVLDGVDSAYQNVSGDEHGFITSGETDDYGVYCYWSVYVPGRSDAGEVVCVENYTTNVLFNLIPEI